MRCSSSLVLLSLVGFFLSSGCSDPLNLLVSNPCDPAYTGDQVCAAHGVDAGGDLQADSGVDGGLPGVDVGVDGANGMDSGFCLCVAESACCDGCHPIDEGVVCGDDGLPCTQLRCSAGGTCESVVLEGWCLVEGVCHNTHDDPLHCGSCGHGCGQGQICSDGLCVDDCPGGQVVCDGDCVFLDNDPLHCGECGHGCGPEQVCREGTCVLSCGPGLTECGGSCVSLMDDPLHCGGCGMGCSPNGTCTDGECLVPVTGLTLSPPELHLTVGLSEQLVAAVVPQDATDRSLVWSSSAPGVVLVSDLGLVTATGPGEGEILATTVDGGLVATCPVTVTIPVTGVSITPPGLSLLPGEQGSLSALIIPVDATNQEVIWESSHPGVATVTPTGMVEGVEPGYATIIVTTADGAHQALCEVTVVSTPVTGLFITPSAITIIKGAGGVQLQVAIEPADATDQRVHWSSSDEAAVMVNELGVISGLAGGEATVTATSLSGGESASCVVTVRVPVTGIAVVPEFLVIPPGGTGQLTSTISPADATDQRVTWTCSDQSIATVSATGLVTGHDTGYVTITVQTGDGGYSAAVHVRVGIPVTRVEVEPASLFLMPNDTASVSAVVHPPAATEPEVVWTSSNGAVATVDDAGLVTGVSVGDAIVTATAVDGDFTGECLVNVGIRVTGVSLAPFSLLVEPGARSQLTATVFPPNATDKTISWASGDGGVATVDSSGWVTGVARGLTTITAMTADGGFRATASVQVGLRVTGVEVAPSHIHILGGRTEQLMATVLPPGAGDPSIAWTSSDQAVATVSDLGLVTGVGDGTAIITATTTDGGHTASTLVTVTQAPSGYELIQEGTFTMGSPEDEPGRNHHNESQHQVTITRPFIMKATQVTQGEWLALTGDEPSSFNACGPHCPVDMVSWNMALEYANLLSAAEGLPQCFQCVGLDERVICVLKAQYAAPWECPGYRLPTEAEWEYAARAGTSTGFYTGPVTSVNAQACSSMDPAGWYHSNSGGRPHPVGGKLPNDWGLYDMHGNVWEWTWDTYGGDLGVEPVTDPHGSSVGGERVVRGGSWFYYAVGCRAAVRYYQPADRRFYEVGFRLVRSI